MSVRFVIHVKPNSKEDKIWLNKEGKWCVKIKALPIDGKANTYLQTYLATVFKVPKSKVLIAKGTTNQYKTIEMDLEETVFKTILESFIL